eukprot:SAG31_NODE_11144_length_1061_cov_1.218295_2_plen_258_part_01
MAIQKALAAAEGQLLDLESVAAEEQREAAAAGQAEVESLLAEMAELRRKSDVAMELAEANATAEIEALRVAAEDRQQEMMEEALNATAKRLEQVENEATNRAIEAEANAEAEVKMVQEQEAAKIEAEMARAEAALKAMKVQARTLPMQQKEARDEVISTVINSIALFDNVPVVKRRLLVKAMDAVPFAPGEMIVQEGEPGDAFFVIESGATTILKKSPTGGDDMVLGTLKPRDYFGELALLTNEPRKATIKATDHAGS